MGDFEDRSSAFERVIRYGAESWQRLACDEVATQKARSARNRSAAVRRSSRNGQTRTVVKVWPEVLKAALKAADGDASRLKIVSDTEVWVM